METPEVYQPKTILITGGAGFMYVHIDVRVINLDKLDYCSCLKNLECIEGRPNYKFVRGDILQADLVHYLVKEHAVDTIIHFAAQTHVDNAFGNSLLFTRNNIEGTHVLLETALLCRAQIKRFVMVSSDEVYGQTSAEPVDETAPMRPTQPYAATKAAAEMMATAYRLSYDLPVIITRGNNVYGPHQYPEKVVPKFICLLLRGQPVSVHGSGAAVRSFLYVEDVARAFDIVVHRGRVGEVYNIGTNDEMSMLQLARDLVRRFGYEGEAADRMVRHCPDRPFNDTRYSIRSDRLHALGWRQQVCWEDGITRTVEWYRAHSGNWGNIDAALVPHPRIGMVPQPGGGRSMTAAAVAAGESSELSGEDDAADSARSLPPVEE